MKSTETPQNVPVELILPGLSSEGHGETMPVLVETPLGTVSRALAFLDGANVWRLRYASSIIGTHRVTTAAQRSRPLGAIQVAPYQGANPLFIHGPIHTARDDRHFAHADGTPFFWLADTWWFALAERFGWPDDVRWLVGDRVDKGFTVAMIVAGMLPELRPFDSRGAAKSGFPWTRDFAALNPRFFDEADRKIAALVEAGIVPCIVGAWGYYLDSTGLEVMKRHWRYLVARYAASPVIWCVAGEASLPWYSDLFQEGTPAHASRLAAGWSEVAKEIRRADGFGRAITVHPSPGVDAFSSYDVFDDPDLFDFVMLQTGHWDRRSFDNSIGTLLRETSRQPAKPVVNGEVCYEGILGSNWPDTQRFLFWSHMLSGAAGHSYGAQGLWAFSEGEFVGEAGDWGSATWREAAILPGGAQLGAGRRILEEFSWEQFDPKPTSVVPHADEHDRQLPYAAGIEDLVRLVYFPGGALVDGLPDRPFTYRQVELRDLQPDADYRLTFIDPRTGQRRRPQIAVAEAEGLIRLQGGFITALPSMEDWLLLIERVTHPE